MNRRLLTILVVALLVASGCTWIVIHLVGARVAASKPMATVRVVAAAKDIALGTVLTASDLTTIQIAGAAPQGAILKASDAVGRGAVSDIYQGEPVLESRLAGPGAGGGLAPTIPKGMRACAVRVDDVVGVAGFVIPGTRVDVLASGTPPNAPGNSNEQQTQTLLQDIQVLSAGTDIQKDATGKPKQVQVVNLLVTPEQAEMLSLAANSLKIQLVLRNPLDTETAKVPPAAMNQIFASGAPAPAAHHASGRRRPQPVSNTYSVVVSNGATTTEQKFALPEGQH